MGHAAHDSRARAGRAGGRVSGRPDDVILTLLPAYRRQVAGQTAQLTGICRAMQANSGSPDLSGVRQIAHEMKGQGGSFGFPAISSIAAALESWCRHPRDSGTAAARVIEAHIKAIREAAAASPGSGVPEHKILARLAETASRA